MCLDFRIELDNGGNLNLLDMGIYCKRKLCSCEIAESKIKNIRFCKFSESTRIVLSALCRGAPEIGNHYNLISPHGIERLDRTVFCLPTPYDVRRS